MHFTGLGHDHNINSTYLYLQPVQTVVLDQVKQKSDCSLTSELTLLNSSPAHLLHSSSAIAGAINCIPCRVINYSYSYTSTLVPAVGYLL